MATWGPHKLQTSSPSSTLEQLVDMNDTVLKANIQSSSVPRPQTVSSLPNNAAYMMSRSESIPISNSIRRTSSETQLAQELAEADYKDYMFYSRVVHGISKKERYLQNGYLKYETQMCLNNIVNTRHADIQKQKQADYQNQLEGMGYFVDDHQHHDDPAIPTHESSDDGIFAMDLWWISSSPISQILAWGEGRNMPRNFQANSYLCSSPPSTLFYTSRPQPTFFNTYIGAGMSHILGPLTFVSNFYPRTIFPHSI